MLVLGVIGVVIVVAISGWCAAKVAIEGRRERRRERRYREWTRITVGLPEGSRLTSTEPDCHTLVEIGQVSDRPEQNS